MKTTFLKNIPVIMLCLFSISELKSQCESGETELILSIDTDDWGNEIYWQITPLGNACGNGTIAEGGNIAEIGCNGAGNQDASNGVGYANNSTIVENGICLSIGQSYTLHYMDDYEDGGADFTLFLFGYPMLEFDGMGANDAFTFTISEPLQYDVACTDVLCYSYVQPENIEIKGKFFHEGSEVITSVEMSYSSDGGTPVSAIINDLNIEPYTTFELIHPLSLTETAGNHELSIWISSINGNPDLNSSNDIASKAFIVGPGIPNILDMYLDYTLDMEEIAGVSEGVVHPRDLDFHPVLTRKELWVVLKSTENEGGETVKISNAGENTQNALWQTDGNAWHFMSLPTAIAFSRNENFATSPGVFDANHDGGAPFTGPTLWDSNPEVYAQPSGGNGSHIDMLHESPYSMGIAWEKDNKFWVTCGDHDEIMSFDFQEDHGPGNSDHSDGIIYKYPLPGYSEDSEHEIPDHLIFDHATGWLYVCNSQQNRIVRINTASGTPGADAQPHETVNVYKYMNNFEWEVYLSVGLDAPTGIDIVENRMIVSNYNNGDIHLYDIGSSTPLLLGVIETGEPGIMGVKIGPDGLIWYVNSITNKVMRIAMSSVAVTENEQKSSILISPNPANSIVTITRNYMPKTENGVIQIIDCTGKLIIEQRMQSNLLTIDTSTLTNGVYMIRIQDEMTPIHSQRLVIQH